MDIDTSGIDSKNDSKNDSKDNADLRIVVFGAGGRVGRAAVAEAVARGHRVTAVVRDPAAYRDLEGAGVELVRGDATDAASVA
ncbi:NAD(P)H-binding protein, partial [Streptomyces sp. NPDC055721]